MAVFCDFMQACSYSAVTNKFLVTPCTISLLSPQKPAFPVWFWLHTPFLRVLCMKCLK